MLGMRNPLSPRIAPRRVEPQPLAALIATEQGVSICWYDGATGISLREMSGNRVTLHSQGGQAGVGEGLGIRPDPAAEIEHFAHAGTLEDRGVLAGHAGAGGLLEAGVGEEHAGGALAEFGAGGIAQAGLGEQSGALLGGEAAFAQFGGEFESIGHVMGRHGGEEGLPGGGGEPVGDVELFHASKPSVPGRAGPNASGEAEPNAPGGVPGASCPRLAHYVIWLIFRH